VFDDSGELKVRLMVSDAFAATLIGRLGFEVPPFTLERDFPFTSMPVMVWSVLPVFMTLTTT
jgi:hypothetical protein